MVCEATLEVAPVEEKIFFKISQHREATTKELSQSCLKVSVGDLFSNAMN
jgi:hypothetical protein